MAYALEEITCPICQKGKIKVRYTPRMLVTHYSHAASNKKAVNYMKNEKLIIISGCSNCGASKKDIEKAFKQEKQPTREEVLRRLKEAGLPTKF